MLHCIALRHVVSCCVVLCCVVGLADIDFPFLHNLNRIRYTPPASDAGSSYDAPYKQPTYVPTAQVYQQPPPQATAPAADSGSQGVRRQFAVESKEPPRHELPPAAPEAQKPMVLAKHDHVVRTVNSETTLTLPQTLD